MHIEGHFTGQRKPFTSLPEWFIEYHKRTVCKNTGIIDDPNVLNDEHGDPKYLLRLLMSLMTVSLEINKINKK